MGSDPFQRAEELFHAACELPESERDAYVLREAGEGELASRVLRLLQYESRAGVTSEIGTREPPLAASTEDGLVGRSIGPYRISDRLGEGGFGVVYRAEQDGPLRREVALKVLRAGVESSQVVARFEAERQALAIMDHPGIARVFDAGQADDSLGRRPFFAMELVHGAPVTEYCDTHRLGVHDRLRLFIVICRAVQHAHQKGIIHRDLKPSNILVETVDGVASPKIIDFGIAKALQQPLTDRTLMTEARQVLGTPQYMSPEQADMDGAAVDTRSDIYALGVILYEMLAGVTPLDGEAMRSASISSLQRIIGETNLARPSTQLGRLNGQPAEIARARGTEPAALRRSMRGELDWITMKALEKDRDRRYQSASEFADDIERHLSGRAVLAGPPSLVYHMRTVIRRHRVGLAVAMVLLVAVIVAAAGLILGTIQAREEADRAVSVNEFLRDLLTSIDPDRDGANVRLVEVIDRAAATVEAQFAEHSGQEATVRELLGDVYTRLGFSREAAAQLRLAVAIRNEELGPDHPQTLLSTLDLTAMLINVVDGREAEAVIADLLPRLERVFGQTHPFTIECRRKLAMVHLMFGRSVDAEEVARAALEQARALRPPDQSLLGRLYATLLTAIMHKVQLDEGLSERDREHLLEEAMAMARRVADDTSGRMGETTFQSFDARRQIAEVLLQRGELEEAVRVCRSLLSDSAGRVQECHSIRLRTMAALARALGRQGRYGEAADVFVRRVDCLREALTADNPARLGALSDALPFLDLGARWVEGEAYARELVERFRALAGTTHGFNVAYELYVARFLSKQGRLQEADEVFETLTAAQDGISEAPIRARLSLFLGGHMTMRGEYEEAESHLQDAVAIMGTPTNGTYHSHPDDILLEFITLYEAWGRPEKADEYRAMLSTAGAAEG